MKEIDTLGEGITLRVTPHKGRPGARLAAQLVRIVAPVMSAFRGKSLKDIEKMDISDLSPVFGNVIANLDDSTFDTLITNVFARTTIVKPEGGNGSAKQYDLSKPSQIDDAFEGEFALMLRCAWEAIEVNFGGFFAGKGQSAGDVKPGPEAAA